MKIRDEALAAGERYFFTGKPCKRGHVSKRYVSNGGCDECIHPKSTALAVITKPGEIMIPEREIRISPRVALEQQKLAFQIQKQNHKEALELQRLKLQLQNKTERQVKEERRSVAKTKLVEVRLIAVPEHYETLLSVVWAFAAIRNPLLRRDEIATGQEPDKFHYVLKCFPEDKMEVLRISRELFAQSEEQIKMGREAAFNQASKKEALDRKAEIAVDDVEFNDSKWSDDPR